MNAGAIIAAAISGLVIGIAYMGVAWLSRPSIKSNKRLEADRLRRMRKQMDAFGDKL